MAGAVEATVHFTVTVRSVEDRDHWTTKALETGIVTSGKTRAEAESRNGKAHILLVRRVKRNGLIALADFMDDRGMSYEIGDPPRNQPRRTLHNVSVEELPLAA